MTAALRRLSAQDSLDAIEQALKDDGGVIVEDLLTSDVIECIKAEVADARGRANPGMKHLNPAVQFFYGDKTRHVNGMAAQSRTFATEVMIHPLVLALCDRILLPSCARYQLNLGHLIDRGPGAQAQLLHRDEVVWVHLPQPHAEIQIASMIALEDFRVQNGATRPVPGSHRWPRQRRPEEHEIADAVMPAGSAVIYLGSAIHGAGTNSTRSEWRPACTSRMCSAGCVPRRTTTSRSRPRSRERCRAQRKKCWATPCTTRSRVRAGISGWWVCAIRWSYCARESSERRGSRAPRSCGANSQSLGAEEQYSPVPNCDTAMGRVPARQSRRVQHQQSPD